MKNCSAHNTLSEAVKAAKEDGYRWGHLECSNGQVCFTTLDRIEEKSTHDKFLNLCINSLWDYVRMLGCIKMRHSDMAIHLHPHPIESNEQKRGEMVYTPSAESDEYNEL